MSTSDVTIDLRMQRDGTRWCGVAIIRGPNLKAPLTLYVDGDVRDLCQALVATTGGLPRGGVARASSMARASVRRSLARTTREAVQGHTHHRRPRSSPQHAPSFWGWGWDYPGVTLRLDDALGACDKACEIVQLARSGEPRAKEIIEKVHARAQAGDRSARRSTAMLTEAARLLDEGRCSIRVGVDTTAQATGSQGAHRALYERKLRALSQGSVGHDIASLRERVPAYASRGWDIPELPGRHSTL